MEAMAWRPIQGCMVNPFSMRETVLKIKPAETKKKVVKKKTASSKTTTDEKETDWKEEMLTLVNAERKKQDFCAETG